MEETEETIKGNVKISKMLIFASLMGALGTFQFGWNVGVINNPQNLIKEFVNTTMMDRYGSANPDSVESIVAVVIAIFAAGGLLGALIAGWIGDKFGRINGMMIVTGIIGISGVLMLCCTYAKSYEMLIAGRFFTGLGSGLCTGLVPVYLNEIAPIYIRGSLGLVHQFGIVFGLFSSQVFGLSVLMGQRDLWNMLLGLVLIFALLQAIGLLFCPPSPRYCLYFKKDEFSAKKALRKLRSADSDIDTEFEGLIEEIAHQQNIPKGGIMDILKNSQMRIMLLVGIVLHVSQQFSGINNIFYYSSVLFRSVGVPVDSSEYATLCVGAIMIIVTFISIPLIERSGRKSLHLAGSCGCLVTATLFTIFFSFKKVTGMNYLSILSALLFVACFGSGPGSIPWIVMSELFPESTRSTANSVGISINWLSNLVVGLIFPFLLKGLHSLIFIPFIIINLLCVIFLAIFMKETKGRRAGEDIEVIDEKSPLEVSRM